MGSAQDEMRAAVLQPFPSVPPPTGLTPEQKLAYAAFYLEQHAENTRDKIRLSALCEAAYASKEPTRNAPTRPPHPEPRPNAFREAARQVWKRGTPPPVVKQSRRVQPVFHLQQESNSHVAIARKAIAKLNEYDKTMKPAIEAMTRAKEGKNVNPSAVVSAGASAAGIEQPAVDPSRDPRLAKERP